MRRLGRSIGVGLLALAAGCSSGARRSWLGSPESVAPGVDFYRSADETLIEGAGPIAVSLLKLDPTKVRIAGALSNDEVLNTEAVLDIATRRGAIAAVNALPLEALTNILLYHVTAGRHTSTSVLAAPGYRMLNGDRLTRDELSVAGIAATDISASNGVIHVINSVLIP